nr:MAG TPA_asm: hypothetical protein [Caudoviricetes sp.]
MPYERCLKNRPNNETIQKRAIAVLNRWNTASFVHAL